MKKNIWLILGILLLFSFACTFGAPAPPTEVSSETIATSVALTVAAGGQIPPTDPQSPTALPTTTPLPPTAAATATFAYTATPSVPMVSVSVDTNCRTGPGKVYDYIGALLAGEKAEVVGKDAAETYWVIKNPDASGNCWLWGYYATVSGNTDNLQVYAAPPTPTPTFTLTPVIPEPPTNLSVFRNCPVPPPPLPNYWLTVDLSWDDNSNNEDGFHIYVDGIQTYSIAENVTTVIKTVAATWNTKVKLGVSAYNVTGESSQATVTTSCP